MIINNLARGRSLYHNSNMGAPTGQFLYDFPAIGELLHYEIIRGLALLTRNAPLTESVFYFVSYFSAAIAASLTARRIGLRFNIAIAVGVLYAFLPYHSIKHVQHLLLSSYFALPLIIYAILEIQRPRINHTKRHRATVLVVLGLIAGGTGIYYAIFSFLIVTAVCLFCYGGILKKTVREKISLYLSGMFLTIAVSTIPPLIYGFKNGFYRFTRTFLEVEYYGLKIANLVRPIEKHRLSIFRSFSNQFSSSMIPGEPVEMLGLIGTVGFLILLVYSIAKISSSTSRMQNQEAEVGLSILATVTIISIFLSTVGSFNSLLFVIGLNQIRVWSRITPLISFCALTCVGFMFQQLKINRSKFGTFLIATALLIGVGDQTSYEYVPAFKRNESIWMQQEIFTRNADLHFPRNSLIYQIPNIKFPENGPEQKMEDYHQAFPFIHGSHLRWTYGNAKTRPSNFQKMTRSLIGIDLLRYLKQSDVNGIHITRRGLADEGLEIIRLSISKGAAIIFESRDGEDVLIDIRTMSVE
jgi:phosphoglycerol transferase